MSRQTAQQDVTSSGSNRARRLDPDRMPHRFAAQGEGRGGPVGLDIYIDRDHVIVKRRLAGLPLTLVHPVGTFLGVFAEVRPGDEPGTLTARIGLFHRDPDLTITLAQGERLEDLAADWRRWGEALQLPLLLVEPDGELTRIQDPDDQPGVPVYPQRRRVAALTARRPRFLVRRQPGRRQPISIVHRGEPEIIART